VALLGACALLPLDRAHAAPDPPKDSKKEPKSARGPDIDVPDIKAPVRKPHRDFDVPKNFPRKPAKPVPAKPGPAPATTPTPTGSTQTGSTQTGSTQTGPTAAPTIPSNLKVAPRAAGASYSTISASTNNKGSNKGSLAKGIYYEDITHTLRMTFFRGITISKTNPKVAYVPSFDGYVFKTEDGGKTWDESRLIVERRPFYGDKSQYLYFGIHRSGGSPSVKNFAPLSFKRRNVRIKNIVGFNDIDVAGAGRTGAAENVNFGIGLPGGAPRLQNVVRKFNKPTAGLNIKQTLLLRGLLPTEVRIVVIHPKNPKIVFACTMYGLFMSYDGGLNWVRTFQGADPRGRRIFHVAVDPSNHRRVLLATGNGVYVSNDGGENYLKATQQGVGNGVIDWIYFNPFDPRYVFVGTDYGLLRSKDGGRNWEWIYFTTFPAARVVRYIVVDPFGKKAGYIATHDGLFWIPNILTGGLEDWKRLGGLRFTGMQMAKVDINPKRPGQMWAMSNMVLPNPMYSGYWDTGGAFLWESMDWGRNWRVIYSGVTWGSMQWYEMDPLDPSMLWVAWSRALSRMRRRPPNAPRAQRLSAAKRKKVRDLIRAERIPSVGDLLVAALRYTGVDPQRQLRYRHLSHIKSLVPKLHMSYTRATVRQFETLHNGLYRLPYFKQSGFRKTFDEFRFMLRWDLSPLVFNLDASMFGRIDRLNGHFRGKLANTLHRFHSELRRLRGLMLASPPRDFRVRLFYKLRIDELESYIDFISGGYLTAYRRGGKPQGLDAPWFERWPGTGKEFSNSLGKEGRRTP
jgi:hypothetical protein